MTNKEKRLKARKEFRKYIKITDDKVLGLDKAGIERIANNEVFVQVEGTKFYWISNYGRLVSNIRSKHKYKLHKSNSGNNKGSVHYTLITYDIDGSSYRTETNCAKLVAKHFLEKRNGQNRVWHIDRNVNNNYYKNLVWVTGSEYDKLRKEVISVEDLGRQQEYLSYVSNKNINPYNIWAGIYQRCYERESTSKNVNHCYDESFMCDSWRYDKDAFAEWYNAGYYDCDGEIMMVDKDLLFPGNKEYAPDKCCLLPQTINSALASCTKRRNFSRLRKTKNLPIGVRYDECRKKYYAEIRPFGHDRMVPLSYFDTPEDSFEEYKVIKKAELMILAVRYKSKIPDKIFRALMQYEIKPYGNG